MNLQNIAAGVVTAINPQVPCMLQMSTGYTIQPDGTQQPAYATFTDVPCQIQALTYTDIIQAEGLNIQGTRRSIYINGKWESLNRSVAKGGDMLTMPDGTVWLIAHVLEAWPDWTKVIATLQDRS